MSRRGRICGLVSCIAVGSLALLTGLSNDRFIHDRHAQRAFLEWQHDPTPETEKAWNAARDAAMARDLKFKMVSFGIAAGFGIAAWRLWRNLGA